MRIELQYLDLMAGGPSLGDPSGTSLSVSEVHNNDQHTTKERAPHSEWLINFALATTCNPADIYKAVQLHEEMLRRRDLLRGVRKLQRAMKREPIARQTEIEFPLNLK